MVTVARCPPHDEGVALWRVVRVTAHMITLYPQYSVCRAAKIEFEYKHRRPPLEEKRERIWWTGDLVHRSLGARKKKASMQGTSQRRTSKPITEKMVRRAILRVNRGIMPHGLI